MTRDRPSRQLTRCRSHLLDNVVDGDTGTKIVAWNGDADAVGIQPAGEMAERGTVERLPVTAVNEDDNRAFAIAGKEIKAVPRAGAVGNRARGMLRAIGCGVACPTGHDRGVLRHPRPVVVLDLVVDSLVQDFTMPVLVRISVRRPWSWPTGASIPGHPSASNPKICRRSRSRAPPPSCETRRDRFS
jgi:hypothetical protein